MNHYSKQQAMNNQPRSFVIGTVECVDSQWIFFEDESDEASMLHEVMDDTLELLIDTRWEKAIMVDDRQIKLHDGTYLLRNGDKLRLTKKLPYAYEQLLQSLPKETFLSFTQHLNSLKFSLYDCIYCHNTLCFLPTDGDTKGANFIIYDNEEKICAVQHLFERGTHHLDRFEYTVNDGERSMNIFLD
ncbi:MULTISPECIES: DUF2777 domain-containing protein [Priestia]|uniref:DUF2777 domain-containing protein n=1 Tax=Priestia TaxID=2800373 RepID=UPI0018A2B650|nr:MULTISPECIES: DUF2777 domain-containing protein [Priestia]MDR7244114.1 hypothetical protein [Priestia megaterium]QTL50159.1 DUF2777 domain-containing protein [Priestia aryabhattai]USL43107.1 DUF2777 domain-containing protein [Priestia megaterium]